MSIQLSQLAEGDFSLALQASEHNVVALAPAASLHWPRVIALGEGNGSIHVSLEVPEGCSRRKVKPLTTATIPVIVKLKKNDKRISLQNDEVHLEKPRAEGKFLSGVHTIENRNDPAYVWNDLKEPLVQARQNPILHAGVSTLEIGMYALLGIFCLAISVFVASCAVYAVQFHKKQDERLDKNDPVANAHDWVWLGRATLERRAFNTKRSCSHETYLKCNNRVSRCNQGCSTHLGAALNRRSHVPVTGCKDAPERLGSRKTTDIESVANENANPFCDPELPSSPQRLRPHERRVQIVVNPLECQSTHSDATSQSDRGSPPPVPPHGRPMPSPRASSCCAPAMSATPLERQSWPPTESPINYDVMVEYFDNLKESNA